MEINFNNNSPIYMQIVEKIKQHIIAGELEIGSRLPSVRDLANDFKVNPNTVQKALSELESMGLIFTERTNGKFVTVDCELLLEYKKVLADELTNEYIEKMKKIGFSKAEIIKRLTVSEVENETVRV